MVSTQKQVSDALRVRGRALRWASVSIKILLVALGALVAGIAQFLTFGSAPSPTQMIGVAASFMAFIGAVIVLFVDEDASDQLALAHAAIDEAKAAEKRADVTLSVYQVVDRMIGLYQATGTIRSVLEQVPRSSSGDINSIVSGILQAAGRSLAIAAGFNQQDQWTIAVYRAEPIPTTSGAKRQLRCIAQRRAIECEISSARCWPEGVGVAGVSFSNQREVIVEDLSDSSILSVFQPSGLVKDYDGDRYRSIVAVPVMVSGDPLPWGIVCATSDRVAHFNHVDEQGLKHEEAIRALAGFTALAVVMARSKDVESAVTSNRTQPAARVIGRSALGS